MDIARESNMSIFKWVGVATVVAATIVASACAREAEEAKTEVGIALDSTKEGVDDAVDATRDGTVVAIDKTQEVAEETADDTKNFAEKAVDKTKEIASATGRKATQAVSATGEAITDGWITTRINGRFVDEALLKGSDINVDTQDHVVTLKGTVTSDAARGRAAAVARNTEGVDQVINQLVVGSK
jgi:hyperosmotically inducible protein